MNLHDQIYETNNHFMDTLHRMQENGQPLVLVGAAELGRMTWSFLSRHGVTVDYVAVNQQYIEPDMYFYHLPVLAVEEMARRPQQYNYIIAFNFTPEKIPSEIYDNAAEVLVFDYGFMGVNTQEYITPAFCERHATVLDALYHQLADERSRTTMVAFLNQRLGARLSDYRNVYEPAHYFPKDIVRLHEHEVFIDCGAYTGDTIECFRQHLDQQHAGEPERIIGFEPDPENFKKLNVNTKGLRHCQCINKGVWNENITLHFSAGKQQSSRVTHASEGAISVPCCRIDDILAGDKATFIKMDVEGAELKALEGAAETIKKHRPLLAISVYHKPDDLITIPQYINALYPDYVFYLRGHSPDFSLELVLYAIPPERMI